MVQYGYCLRRYSAAIVYIEVIKNKGELKIDFEDNFADLIVMNDFIHGNDLRLKCRYVTHFLRKQEGFSRITVFCQ
jgi:hypothetical protein